MKLIQQLRAGATPKRTAFILQPSSFILATRSKAAGSDTIIYSASQTQSFALLVKASNVEQAQSQ